MGDRGPAASIALLRDREPVLGVVFAPCAPDDDGDFIAWAEGCGPMTRNGRPVEREPWPKSLDGQVVLVSADADNASPNSLRAVGGARFRPMPSIAYRLALAAAGDGVFGTSFKGAGDWDYAGGHALLRGVGGDLYGHDGGVTPYTAQGESRSRACFGGAPSLVPVALRRPWMELFRRAERDPMIPRQLGRAHLSRGESVADAGLLRRAHGCLLGQLAGDALGSLVEFQSPADIRRRYPEGLRDIADGGTFGTIAGQPTDDSELALALARSIVAPGRYDAALTASSYVYWYATGPFDVGTTTRRALSAAVGAGAAQEALDAATRSADAGSQANGSLMRISPLGIWGAGMDPEALAEVARADSRITHPNVVCQEACVVYVIAIAHAIETGAGPRDVYAYALNWAQRHSQDSSVVDALVAAERAAPADFMTNSGWVLTALQNAFFRLLHAETLEAGVIGSAMAGGDTDTNAAIAGALLGAVHGREAIPVRWRNPILTCRPLADAPGVRRPRPRPFWPVDALELAERLLLAREV
jgi:ADP-ribosylglycohydrolase